MTTKNTTILTPILYDALGEPVRVDASSIPAALKSVRIEGDMLGFEFSRRAFPHQVYMFAEQVYTIPEYAAIAKANPDTQLSRQFNSIPAHRFADPESIVYTSALGVRVLEHSDHTRVALVDKKGTQLFPRPK